MNWRDKAVAEGKMLARGIFALRGNNTEIHVKETDLAASLALAYEHGVRAAEQSLRWPIGNEFCCPRFTETGNRHDEHCHKFA